MDIGSNIVIYPDKGIIRNKEGGYLSTPINEYPEFVEMQSITSTKGVVYTFINCNEIFRIYCNNVRFTLLGDVLVTNNWKIYNYDDFSSVIGETLEFGFGEPFYAHYTFSVEILDGRFTLIKVCENGKFLYLISDKLCEINNVKSQSVTINGKAWLIANNKFLVRTKNRIPLYPVSNLDLIIQQFQIDDQIYFIENKNGARNVILAPI